MMGLTYITQNTMSTKQYVMHAQCVNSCLPARCFFHDARLVDYIGEDYKHIAAHPLIIKGESAALVYL